MSSIQFPVSRFLGGLLLLTGVALGQAVVPPQPMDLEHDRAAYKPAATAAEIQARYDAVLAVMKKPPAAGVLVVEIGPASAGGSGGMRAGDVIVQYDTVKLDGPGEKDRVGKLRAAVAEAAAESENEKTNPVTLVSVNRGGRRVGLQVQRGALGVRVLAVEAGVERKGNPPESVRGTFGLAWAERSGWFHASDGVDVFAAQKRELAVEGREGKLKLELHSVGEKREELAAEAVTFAASDRRAAYGFMLDTLEYRDELVQVKAQRKGMVIKGAIKRVLTGIEHAVERPTVPETAPSEALAEVAGTLPREAGVVLPIAVLSEQDLETRLGYALEARGKVKVMLFGQETDAFAVRLWHFGEVLATYYYGPAGELIKVEQTYGVGLDRAASAEAALKGTLPEPAKTRPATRPTTER